MKLATALALAVSLVTMPALAKDLNLSEPNDALKAQQKITCSLTDGKTIVWTWAGKMYSRVPGEKDRHVFNVEGMNIRQCKTFSDAKRGHGFRSVSREIMLYLDPVTNEVLRTWKNPWTNETVDVLHVANDPVNMRQPMYAFREDGTPYKSDLREQHGMYLSAGATPLFYDNPLQGKYQDYVGGKYHAMEMGGDFVKKAELLSGDNKEVQEVLLSWGRISGWLPWMKMGDRPGLVVFVTTGMKLFGIDDLSPTLKAEIEKNYPLYKNPPPIDDARPNETSWTVFRDHMEGVKKQPAGAN